jgi:hypothetical protein
MTKQINHVFIKVSPTINLQYLKSTHKIYKKSILLGINPKNMLFL